MKNRNWTGNSKSVFSTLGASSHTKEERQREDYYATDPKALDLLFKEELFDINIWEPACGEGHLSKRMTEFYLMNVYSSDLIDRGYGEVRDFLSIENLEWNGDIITNPPYKYAQEFIEKSMQIIPEGNKIAMFLKLQFLEGKKRKQMFRIHPPKTIYVSSSRIQCAKNAEFARMKKGGGSAIAYCWYVWEKGYKGDTIIKWIN